MSSSISQTLKAVQESVSETDSSVRNLSARISLLEQASNPVNAAMLHFSDTRSHRVLLQGAVEALQSQVASMRKMLVGKQQFPQVSFNDSAV